MPAKEIRDNADVLHSQLKVAARALSATLADKPEGAGDPIVALHALFEVQLYSRAVQVFTAMAVEVALNTYGLMRFGAEQFASVEHYGLRKKVLTLLDHDRADLPSETDPVVIAVTQLAERRNALVHQQSDETSLDSEGGIQFVGDPVNPDVSCEAGEAAMFDMEFFFREFPRRDGELAWLLQF